MSAACSRADVERLLARAGFGATPADVDRWAGRPYDELVSWLVDVPDQRTRPALADDHARLAIERAARDSPREAMIKHLQSSRLWWLERMRTTPYPLEERMTLFWHDHFATGFDAPFPDVSMLLVQNETFRTGGLGRFDSLLRAVTLDPAMLYWLDGARSATPRPNENFARELFELFALGVKPQIYSEHDVREAARALTGWTVDLATRQANFDRARHDRGEKAVLGSRIDEAGAAEVDHVVRIALAQGMAPLFIAWKLVRAFGWATAPSDLSREADPVVRKVAAVLQTSNWDVRAAMRALLLDDRFRYADAALGRRRVRTPAEVTASVARAIGVPIDDAFLLGLMRRMGQELFSPPDVGGWPVGSVWLAPGAFIARYDWAMALFTRWHQQPAASRKALPPATDLEAWAAILGIPDLSAATKAAITHSFEANATDEQRQAGVLALMVTSPEWMVV